MGFTGIILQKNENIDLNKMIDDVKIAALRAQLELRLSGEIFKSQYDEYFYTYVNLANKYDGSEDEQQVLMYLYSSKKNDYLEEFDWICKDGHLVQSINIEDISGCEEILLYFLYEYMYLNPDVIFWNECEWYFSFKDIDKIYNSPFDCDWCYKKPKK